MRKYILISVSLTIASYLIASFVLWDIACIKYIPELEPHNRGLLVMSWVVKELITFAFYKINTL